MLSMIFTSMKWQKHCIISIQQTIYLQIHIYTYDENSLPMQFLSTPNLTIINYSSVVKEPHKEYLNKQNKVNIASNEQFDNVCH